MRAIGDSQAGGATLLGDEGEVAYLCECADPHCLTAVRLTRAEYARLRPGAVLAPGHQPARASTHSVRQRELSPT